MGRQSLRLVGAGAIAVLGVGLAWWALGPLGSGGAPASSVDEGSEGIQDESNGASSLSRGDFETDVTPENVIEVAAQGAERVAASLRQTPHAERLSDIAREILIEEARTQMLIYLSGSFERYMDYTQRRGARMPDLESGDPETKQEKLKGFWRSTVEPVAMRPVSLDDVRAVPRYVRGRKISQSAFPCGSTNISHDRYELSDVPTRSKDDLKLNAQIPERYEMTIYEVLVPVHQKWRDQESPGYLGIWLAWDEAKEQWTIWKICGHGGVGVLPIY